MRLKICCCYCSSQNSKDDDRPTLPRVVAEQPKRRQPLPLDKVTEVTEVPAEEPAVQRNEVDSAETVPDKDSSDTESAALPVDVKEIKSATQFVPVTATPHQDDCSGTAPNATSRQDSEVKAIEEQKIDSVASSSTEQSQSTVSFTVIDSGHLKSVYKGTEFYILNGEIERINGPYDESDKKFMLAQYEAAMVGVKQAVLGIEQGLGINTGKFTDPLRQLLASHNPPCPPSPQNGITQRQYEQLLELLRTES